MFAHTNKKQGSLKPNHTKVHVNIVLAAICLHVAKQLNASRLRHVENNSRVVCVVMPKSSKISEDETLNWSLVCCGDAPRPINSLSKSDTITVLFLIISRHTSGDMVTAAQQSSVAYRTSEACPPHQAAEQHLGRCCDCTWASVAKPPSELLPSISSKTANRHGNFEAVVSTWFRQTTW